MSVVENEACDAIALGFPPYRRSPLPSRTYQAFTHFLALFDQPSHLISPSPPIAPESELGQEIQEKEATCYSKNNSLTEKGVEDNETITHFPEGKEDGVEEEKEEGFVGEAEIEEGEISDINLPDDFDFDDFRQFGEPDVDLGQIHKDKQGECPAGVDEKGAYESDADERHIHKDKQGEFFASIKQKGAHESDAVEEQIHKDRQGEFPASIEEKGAHETDTDEGHIHKDKQGEFPASMENTGAYESAAVEGQIHKDKQGEFPASMENKGAYESDALVNSSDVGVGTSRETLSLEELKKKQAELSCRKICSYEEIVGDYGICDAEKEVKRSKASSKPDDAGNSKRIVDKNEGCEAGSKRKRTEHSKKNKKEKRRKKRAEENRKSGVKRLRLEPNPKKKTINYCRYFLHGKCQQGDSCKFSHDTAPLTKTTVPCTHFAINNCLKGDNCPYDHDLSKYPCNNYKTTGFCRRGDKCFFSHKMSPMNDPSPVSDVSKNTQEASSLQARASSGKKLPTNGRTSQPTPMKPPANVPKGMNFLSFGKNPSDGSSKQEKGESPTVRGSEITVSGINQGAVERFDNPNERLWSPTPPAVSGISQGAVEKSYNLNERLWLPTPHAGSETNQGAVEKFQNSNERLWSPTPPVPQFSKMMTNRQDTSTSNSAPHLKTQVKNASDSAQKAQPSSTSKYPAPSTASVGNLPTISNILQEFLFNGQ